MIRQYFKQAWQLIKQNKLFSAIYIVGTALGISMVMIMAITNDVKTSNVYPEYNRDRILYLKSMKLTSKDTTKWTASGGFSQKAVKELFLPFKTPETVSVEMESNSAFVSLPGNDEMIKIKGRFVDSNYWKVFNFSFISGKPFSEADFQAALPVAVVSESLAKKLFGNADIVGKYIEYEFKNYRISGVVKDVSYAISSTYAEIWMPFSILHHRDVLDNEYDGMMGDINNVYLLAKSKSDFDAIRKEVNDRVNRYNSQSSEYRINLLGQPDTKRTEIHRVWSNLGPNMTKINIRNFVLIFLLLLVPAVNLSGMNSTRMERRLGEMGVRKAFGAARSKLINQVLTENLLLTGLGGVVGLLLSYGIIFGTREWILEIGKQYVDIVPEGTSVDFSFSMLFNLKIFGIVLIVCLAMNILSALIPIYRSLRKNIVDSLYIKYN